MINTLQKAPAAQSKRTTNAGLGPMLITSSNWKLLAGISIKDRPGLQMGRSEPKKSGSSFTLAVAPLVNASPACRIPAFQKKITKSSSKHGKEMEGPGGQSELNALGLRAGKIKGRRENPSDQRPVTSQVTGSKEKHWETQLIIHGSLVDTHFPASKQGGICVPGDDARVEAPCPLPTQSQWKGAARMQTILENFPNERKRKAARKTQA